MMFKTHLAFGLLSSLILFNYLDISLILLPISLFASVLPDIDQAKSKIGRKFRIFSKIINILFNHRGIIHSIYIPILFYILFYILNQKIIGLVFIIGYFSHLLIDGITVSGINFLHPLINLKLSGFIETNSFQEFLLFIILLIINVYLIINYIL